jgi:calcineurin-like phosphoesterase
MIRVLFIGDISGKPGRDAVAKVLPDLKKKEKIDDSRQSYLEKR